MCSGFIRFVLKVNQNTDLKITDFESEWAIKNKENNVSPDTIVYITKDNRYYHSEAIIHLLADANNLFIPLLFLKLIPKSIRNGIYKVVSRNRHKIIKTNKCRLPTQKEKSFFLQ